MTTTRRVEIPAHFDSWARGDRFGAVVKVTRTHTHVRLDRSGRMIRIRTDLLDTYGREVSR